MPTFNFYRNSVKIDSVRGADPAALEEKIKKWYGDADGDEEGAEEVPVKGHVSWVKDEEKNLSLTLTISLNTYPHTTKLQQTTLNIFCQQIDNLYN